MPRYNIAREQAFRLIVEVHGVPLKVVAELTGRTLGSVQKQARTQGWNTEGADERILDRLRQASLAIARRIEALLRVSGDEKALDKALDKAEIDALNSAVRVTEKLIEILTPDEIIKDLATDENEKLADVLARVNDRIIYLARKIAGGLAEGKSVGECARD